MSTIVLLSGGLDSTVLLAASVNAGDDPIALTIDYGQKSRTEIRCAANVTRALSVPHRTIGIMGPVFGPDPHPLLASTPTAFPITAAEADLPGRNALLVVMAAAHLGSGGGTILIGSTNADGFPDSTPESFRLLSKALSTPERPVSVRAPLCEFATREEIADYGQSISDPLQLTSSCWDWDSRRCGGCGSCVDRTQALSGLVGYSASTPNGMSRSQRCRQGLEHLALKARAKLSYFGKR